LEVIPMPSTLSLLVIFSIIVFIGGSVFGMLTLFIVSIHCTRRTSLHAVSGQRRGKVSRCVLVTPRSGRRAHGE
jgi:hypothetical protein